MPNAVGILKKDRVRPGGTRRLGGQAGTPAGAAAGGAARARIVEQTGDGAVVEIICPCGRRIRVQCLYDAPDAAGANEQTPSEPSQGEQT
jgi:hypothetical protein